MATLPAATGIEQLGPARRASRWRAELRLFLGAYVAYNVARWVFAGGVGAEADAPTSAPSGGGSTPSRTWRRRRFGSTRCSGDSHVLPRLGSDRLREPTPAVINRFRLELENDRAGRASIANSLTPLQGLLQRPCDWERLGSNPARPVRRPRTTRIRTVTPLPHGTVERGCYGAISRATGRWCRCSPTPGLR